MPNYHPNAKSLVYGLSDFWTLYFQELPVIEEIYRGMEVDLGQVYLDLLSLLLNTSVQDTTIFNKKYFQLVRMREDAVTYASDGRYGIALDTNVADIKYLNNKVFGVTAALEKNVDFIFDTASRSALFEHDPFSAYRATTFGTGNASFTVTTRVTEPLASQLRLQLSHTATHPPVLVRSNYDFTVQYDVGTTSAADVVSLLNTNEESRELFSATLPGTTTGADDVVGFGFTRLRRQATAPLQGFATRSFDVLFGTRFYDRLVPNWLDLDVQKGDVLRIIDGPAYGPPQEFPIALVKDDRLILYPQVAPADIAGGLDYVVLRSPVDDEVVEEPYENSGLAFPFDTNATITGATRTIEFGSPIAVLNDCWIGDILVLHSAVNAGQYRIAEIIQSPYSFVLDGNPLVDETNVSCTLVTSTGGFVSDGVITAPVAGIATASSASFPFSPVSEGTVLIVLEGGAQRFYNITRYINTTTVEIAVPNGVTPGTGLTFGITFQTMTGNTVVYSAPTGWLVPGSVTINARRRLDGAAVQEGVDYIINPDLGTIQALSIWEASQMNRIDYRYRLAVHASSTTNISSGSDGTLALSPAQFSSPSLALTQAHVGAAITITGAADDANDGVYYIESIINATTAQLSSTHTPVLPEGNNGSLDWELYARASAVVTDVREPVTEMGVWAPDALVDEYHLYFTYGYLINRIQTSSEAYRSLIRGLFQLFMLGPTLERFESAINIVASLPVIRDDGEIFLRYESGALRSGTDGIFDSFTRTFTSASAVFTPADLSNRIYVVSGLNENKIFTIAAVLSATTVELAETPTSDSTVSWEITATAEHAIVTSRTRYAYPRSAPLKAKFLDTANEGVLSLRAFEVVTAAFEVTDYVETPTWWENARIPATLLPDYTPQRRQSTPALFENIIGAGDGACVGDPGFFVGADDEGDVIPTAVLRSGVGGILYGDPFYPSSTENTFFEGVTPNFTTDDVGNYVRVGGASYRISAIVSTTRVRIVSYVPLPITGTAPATWEVIAGTIPLRHTAAYVILDRLLKYHLFTVRFDGYLLDQLPSNVIRDLQELVFVAKPTYTYLVLTPTLLFEELIRMEETEFSVERALQVAGGGGETVLGNTNPLLIGPSWTIGSWYRYITNVGSFVAPISNEPDVLGTPAAGYQHRVTKVYITPTAFLEAGRPISYDRPVATVTPISGTLGEITLVGGETIFNLDPMFGVPAYVTFYYIRILAPSPNAGEYRIGRVYGVSSVVIDAPGLVPETNIAWEIYTTGTQQGTFSVNSFGESLFLDNIGEHPFVSGHGGTYIRRPYVTASQQQVYRIDEVLTPSLVRVAQRYSMLRAGETLTADVTSAVAVDVPGMLFDTSMTYLDRFAANPATSRQREYFIEFLSGTNTGTVVGLQQYVTPTTVNTTGGLTPELGVTITMFYRDHYTGASEGGVWEHYEHYVHLDNYSAAPDLLTLPTTGVTPGVVPYTAYGVQEPEIPIVATFDEAAGDTYYAIGGVDPVLQYMRSRTALDVDLIESPAQIRRSPVTFSLTSALTFSRASTATYYTGAPTDGTVGFIGLAAINTPRIQNRGTRPALFLEGGTENICQQSRSINLGAFLAGVTVTTTANVGPGVDGVALADRSNVTAGGYTRNYQVISATGWHSVSLFLRANAGTSNYRAAIVEALVPGSVGFTFGTAGTTWAEQRTSLLATGVGFLFIPTDGRDYSGVGGGGPGAADIRTDYMQIEARAFSSSTVNTSGFPGFRSPDIAYIASGSVPAWMQSGGWSTTIAPEFTSTEFINHATDMTLFAFGTGVNSRIALVLDAGAVKVRVTVSGVDVVTSGGITFGRWQDMVLTFSSSAGSVTISGASSGDGTTVGTAWSMPAGDLYIGNSSLQTSPYYGEVLPVVTAV